jgi:hypothetical protein
MFKNADFQCAFLVVRSADGRRSCGRYNHLGDLLECVNQVP